MDPVQIILGLLVAILILVMALIVLVIVAIRRNAADRGTEMLTSLMTEQLKIFGDTKEKLGELSAIGAQVNHLSGMLQKTQQRGVWGEQILDLLLDNILPNHHGPVTFADGQKVEQALHLPDGKIVAIDSKFVLDAFHRLENAANEQEKRRAKADLALSLRDRIDETAKYIRPTEGTLDFALMFLPAESVYYRLCSDDEVCFQDGARQKRKRVWDYALERRVIPVSPNTLYAYLTVIVYGLRGLQIEQKTREILQYLQQLENEFYKLHKDWGILGVHLKNTRQRYEDLDSAMTRFGDRLNLETVTGLAEEDLPAAGNFSTDQNLT